MNLNFLALKKYLDLLFKCYARSSILYFHSKWLQNSLNQSHAKILMFLVHYMYEDTGQYLSAFLKGIIWRMQLKI